MCLAIASPVCSPSNRPAGDTVLSRAFQVPMRWETITRRKWREKRSSAAAGWALKAFFLVYPFHSQTLSLSRFLAEAPSIVSHPALPHRKNFVHSTHAAEAFCSCERKSWNLAPPCSDPDASPLFSAVLLRELLPLYRTILSNVLSSCNSASQLTNVFLQASYRNVLLSY